MTVAETIQWDRPVRGRVAMFGLIAAEAAIFSIFVVAYLFYIGKSLTGPMPKDVLSVPIFYTICLLSSSLTIHLAVSALRRKGVRGFAVWWFATIALGTAFMYGTATEWHHLLLIGRTARVSRRGGAYCSLDSYGAGAFGKRESGAR